MARTTAPKPGALISILAALVALFFTSLPAHAASTYYVATTGSDSNLGTIDAPFKTISYAATKATVAGTQVLVRGGTYNQTVRISTSGAPGTPNVFKAYPGETPVIDGNGVSVSSYDGLVRITGNYVEFRGFEVKRSSQIGIWVPDTQNVTIADNSSHSHYRNGILIEGSSGGTSHDNIVQNNRVYDNVLANSVNTGSSGWDTGLQAADSNNNQFIGNQVYQNYGEGVSALRATGTQIINNVVWDNFSVNVYADNAPSTRIERNFIYATGDTRFLYNRTQRPLGIATAIESYSSGMLPLTNLTIANNITTGVRYGFYYGNYGRGGGIQNSLIANNTFVNATDADVWFESSSFTGTSLSNNVMFSTGAPLAGASGSVSTLSLATNCWYGAAVPAAFVGSGDVNANPMLASPGSLDPSGLGYIMSPSSACAAAAPLKAQVPKDYFDKARTNPTSMGATQPGEAVQLTVSRTGSGSGTVTSSPAGISCPSTCAAGFASGSNVVLTATAATGSTFTGWSGGTCSGTGTCSVTMNGAQSVTANFDTLPSYSLTVTKVGDGGLVTSSPTGINCGSTCAANYPSGTSVTLTASATAGWAFDSWSGDTCFGTTPTCVLNMSGAKSVTATFKQVQPVALTVAKAGTGSGTVTSSPAGINCGSTCSANFNPGENVVLTAQAAAGSTFSGWSGTGVNCPGTGTCTVTVSAAQTVTATFNVNSNYTLTVTKSGTGSGTVTSSPAGINCGSTCSATYTPGRVVTLYASAAFRSRFVGWTGACTTTSSTCRVTMTGPLSVNAIFRLR